MCMKPITGNKGLLRVSWDIHFGHFAVVLSIEFQHEGWQETVSMNCFAESSIRSA